MEEEQAHELYTQFQAVDKGAKQKQGLGFAGAAPERREFAGDNDDVIARNKRLRGSLFGTASRPQDADSEGYDSDSAAAVVKRLKQLRQGQGSHAAHEKEPRREGERDAGSRCRSSGQERICEDRSHRGGSRRDDGREHRSSRDRELHDSDSRDARHSHKGGQRGSERDRHSSRDRGRDRGRDRDRDRDRRDGDRAKREEPRASRYAFSRSYSHRQHSKQQAQPPKAAKPDFERVIPGYATMSAAQKLKARTQYLLERSSQRDKQRQADRDRDEEGDAQWTRYTFDQNAYLDEEGGRPADPAALDGFDADQEEPREAAGLGGRRGQLAPRVNAVTFKQSVVAAELQGRDASHEAAIFGRAHANGATRQAAAEEPVPAAPQASTQSMQGCDGNDRDGGSNTEALTAAQRLRLRLARGVAAPPAEPASHFAGLGAERVESGWREVPSREGGQTDGALGGDGRTLTGDGGGQQPGIDNITSAGLVDAGIAERQAQLGWRQRALQARQGKHS